MERFAAIDVGTNSVLLLVAERRGASFVPVLERAEITRLGKGVDKTKRLAPDALEDTLRVVTEFAQQARGLGAAGIAVSATSAARDAENGAEFIEGAKRRADVTVEIISGELEAQLSFKAVHQDFASTGRPLVVIDIGGGSTELIYGGLGARSAELAFRHSFDVGSVRLTERFVRSDPLSDADRAAINAHLEDTFAALPRPPQDALVVGVAGTVTTLYAVLRQIDPYDPERVQGGVLSLEELRKVSAMLCSAPLDERRALPGIQPKRADVIPAGALILQAAVEQLGATSCTVSDRGLRWGLLVHKFG